MVDENLTMDQVEKDINENIVKWVLCLVPDIDAPSTIGSTCLVDMYIINKLEKWLRFLCAC
jgi:hypothetical protein